MKTCSAIRPATRAGCYSRPVTNGRLGLLVPSISGFCGSRRCQALGGARGLTLTAHSQEGRRNVSGERCSETTTTIAQKTRTQTRFAQNSPGPACPDEAATVDTNTRTIRLNRQTTVVRLRSADFQFIRPRLVGLPTIFLTSSVYINLPKTSWSPTIRLERLSHTRSPPSLSFSLPQRNLLAVTNYSGIIPARKLNAFRKGPGSLG